MSLRMKNGSVIENPNISQNQISESANISQSRTPRIIKKKDYKSHLLHIKVAVYLVYYKLSLFVKLSL